MKPLLEIKDLHAEVNGKKILNGIDLTIKEGEIHALMGPNGSGKSTLSNIILGNPKFLVTKGTIEVNGKNILKLDSSERAKWGLFLSFQYPVEIPGISLQQFLWSAFRAQHPQTKLGLLDFIKLLKEKARIVGLDDKFLNRELNVGFSGGEKKRAEILQLLVLEPKLALLDETDSGLDIDSLKLVGQAVNWMRNPSFASLIITHYRRILDYVKPDFVHVLVNGKIVLSGKADLAEELEDKGYGWITTDNGTEANGKINGSK